MRWPFPTIRAILFNSGSVHTRFGLYDSSLFSYHCVDVKPCSVSHFLFIHLLDSVLVGVSCHVVCSVLVFLIRSVIFLSLCHLYHSAKVFAIFVVISFSTKFQHHKEVLRNNFICKFILLLHFVY